MASKKLLVESNYLLMLLN